MEFNLINLAITVRTDNAVSLRNGLLKLVSNFAHACRSVVCRWPLRVCDTCSVNDSCAWYSVFGQQLATDPTALKRHQKPPLPFVFSFPMQDMKLEEPCDIECGLVVAGRAVQHMEMLLGGFASHLSGDACLEPATIELIGSRDYQGNIRAIGNGGKFKSSGNLAVLSVEGILQNYPWQCSGLGIRLLSPLRLIENGRLLKKFDFSRFARSVMRRVSSLAYYYGGYEFDCDFKALSNQADSVVSLEECFSNESAGNRNTPGLTGYGNFGGEIRGLLPFLVLGMYFNAGKGAAYGMGRYELIFDNQKAGQ